jgi:hypothetical protein
MTSLWDDTEIQRTITMMDPETRYAKIGENLYNKGGLYDTICSIDKTDPESNMLDSATQIDLMIRDGMSIDDLTTEEIEILKNVFGIDGVYEKYGIVLEPEENDFNISYFENKNNEQTTDRCLRSNNGTDKGTEKHHDTTKRARKSNLKRNSRLSKSNR